VSSRFPSGLARSLYDDAHHEAHLPFSLRPRSLHHPAVCSTTTRNQPCRNTLALPLRSRVQQPALTVHLLPAAGHLSLPILFISHGGIASSQRIVLPPSASSARRRVTVRKDIVPTSRPRYFRLKSNAKREPLAGLVYVCVRDQDFFLSFGVKCQSSTRTRLGRVVPFPRTPPFFCFLGRSRMCGVEQMRLRCAGVLRRRSSRFSTPIFHSGWRPVYQVTTVSLDGITGGEPPYCLR
jgi:hypothetical protein